MSDLWFAWRPVMTIDGKWAWLRRVHRYRRDNHIMGSEGHRSWWEYSLWRPNRRPALHGDQEG